MDNLDRIDAKGEVLDLVWNNTTDAIFTIGHDGAVLNANQSFIVMLGYELDELAGISYPPFFICETKEEHQTFLKQLRAGQHFPYLPSKRINKAGKVIDVLASYRAVNNEEILAVGMYKDFTEQMAIQQRLEESEHLYRMLVEHLPAAIIKQRNGKIEFMNAAGIHLIGKARLEEVIGFSVWDFVTSAQQGVIQEQVDGIYERSNWEEPITLEGKFSLQNGREIYTEIKIIPIGTKEKPDIQLVISDVTEKKQYEAKLQHLAYHDPLTGLKNRRIFSDIVADALYQARMEREKIAILYIDLDEFKEVNDQYGHDVGDQLLQQFARRLETVVRKDDVLSRVGGDEFLALLSGIRSRDEVDKIMKRMQAALQQPYEINGIKLTVTSSIGIALSPRDGIQGRTLIYHADQALYQSKQMKNHYTFY